MGASLAFDALNAAKRVGLAHAPTRLLVRLALSALDGDSAPWARLTMADRCSALGCDDDTAGRSAVRRATAAIVAAGLAKLTEGGNRSGAARYSLTLAEKGSRSTVSIGDGKVTAERQKANRSAVRKLTAHRSAKEDRGDTEEETRAGAPRPEPRCTRHLAVVNPPPCRACGDARRSVEAFDAAETRAAHARRAAERLTLDPAAVQAVADRFGGRYSAEAITEAARAAMPDNLAVGLRILDRLGDEAADELARWER